MTNRRQFLAGGLAGSALMTSLHVRAGALLADPAHHALGSFVFDERFEQAARLAQDLGQLGTRAYAVRGDVSEVWYDHLAPSLQAGSRAIGGLTTAGGLFVLSRLGHDAGLTLIMHGWHRLVDDGRKMEHALDAPQFIERQFNATGGSGLSWTSALQAVLIELASRPPADRLTLSHTGTLDTARQMTLHSWLLTPRP